MKAQLIQIQRNKAKETKRLLSVKNKIIVSIYEMVINNKNNNALHTRLKKETLQDTFLYKPALRISKQIKREIDRSKNTTIKSSGDDKKLDNQEWVATLFLLAINKLQVSNKLSKCVYKEKRKQESEAKEKLLKEMLSSKRPINKDDPKVFFLVSKHSDCAKDHIEYQGQIYIDENWKKLISNSNNELKVAIENYIRINNIKSYQWVIGKPVWMITRPNCRHFAKVLSVSEVLNNPTWQLLVKNKMTMKEGDRELRQTLRHNMSSKKGNYNEKNINAIIDKYKERLELHTELNKVKSTQELRHAITKDKFLIKKWQNFLKSLTN